MDMSRKFFFFFSFTRLFLPALACLSAKSDVRKKQTLIKLPLLPYFQFSGNFYPTFAM